MARYVLWRLIQFPVVLAIIYLVTYLLVWLAPGSPFDRGDRKMDPVVKDQLEKQFHADSPGRFLAYYPWRMLHGDFGPSLTYQGWSVGDVLKTSLRVSIKLGLMALTIAVAVGCTLGTLSALKRGGVFDLLTVPVTLVGISLPAFVSAGLLLVVFSDKLHWFPAGGLGNNGLDGFYHMILPATALSLGPLAYIAQLTRVSMLDVMGDDYVRTARAKGLGRSAVVWKHCFRNAVLPVFTYLGPAAAAALTGSFVIEYVFNLPGLGQHFVNGVINRDQTLILGTVMVYAVFLLGLNLLVDLGYAVIDPRIEVSR
jgi:oligopeptide transport system permease protein